MVKKKNKAPSKRSGTKGEGSDVSDSIGWDKGVDDVEVDDSAWQALVEGPAHEAGVFYNQIHDEIKTLRERVDSKLKDMMTVGKNDVETLNRQVQMLKTTASSDSGDQLPAAAEIGAGYFQENLPGLAEKKREEAAGTKNKKKSKKDKPENGSYQSLYVTQSEATEPATNQTRATVAKRLHKINFPEDRFAANNDGDDSSDRDEPRASSPRRNRLRPQRRRKKSPTKRQQPPQGEFSPSDAVTKARNFSNDDAVTNARYGRASPPRRRFFPDDDHPAARRRPQSQREPPPEAERNGAALVPVESTRSPYADEIRNAAQESYNRAERPLQRTASEVRRSIAVHGGGYPAKLNETINLVSDSPGYENELSGPVLHPRASPTRRKAAPTVPPVMAVNKQLLGTQQNQQDHTPARVSNEKRLDLLMASLEYLDNGTNKPSNEETKREVPERHRRQSTPSLTPTQPASSPTRSRKSKHSNKPSLRLPSSNEEKKADGDDWDDHQSYTSRSIAMKTSNLQSLAESSVTKSMALQSHISEPSSDLLKEIDREVGFEDGFVKVEKVQCRSIVDPYGDRGRYSGLLVKGRPYGHGSMHYDDGRSYTGDWKNGRWHGKGRTLFVNGDFFVGDYVQDQRHGLGRYEWSDGRIFDGSFKHDQREGKGTYAWPDGSIYSGDFKSGHRHGQGCYKFKDGSVFTGEFAQGRYHGVGECVWADGRTYRGEWSQGHAHGYGVETRADGSIRHDGEWKKDRPVRDEKTLKKLEEKKEKKQKKKQTIMPENLRDLRPKGYEYISGFGRDPTPRTHAWDEHLIPRADP